MDVQRYFNQLDDLHLKILDFIEDDENDYCLEIINFIEELHIIDDPYEFKSFLSFISEISNNHQRVSYFYDKFEKLLLHFKSAIKQTFSNFSIFNIFKYNKRILFFLITNDIIKIDDTISEFIIENKISTFNLDFELEKKFIKHEDDEEFLQKCKIGENDSYICQLIRNDLIKEFIIYMNKNNISIFQKIPSSIFETNFLLNLVQPTLIEYAAFFGSIQIFQYLRFNGADLDSNLWIYAIHSKNGELIHIIEENDVEPPKNKYYHCLVESIKCHHHDIENYINDRYLQDYDIINLKIIKICLKYHNFHYIRTINFDFNKFNDLTKELFLKLCRNDYYTLVKYYLQEKKYVENIKKL